MMTGVTIEKWNRVKDAFMLALEAPAEGRREILREFCAGDQWLFAEALSLLEAHTESGAALEKNAFDLAARLGPAAGDYRGRRFGRYRVTGEIGHGGMGTVFLAARDDGEFEQKAALKIIRQSYTGAPEIERHFRRERQILARLNHPNIARLLDGGVSDRGELYLVMEYVEGLALLGYAEENELSLDERLRLFLKVCRAVSFAHENLIIHRDLKPSNILVTRAGEPKLLDFGLAKITMPAEGFEDAPGREPDQDADTKTQFHAFTANYAAPEQIQGLAVTTRSDVFSLGVVLFELLTGEKPFHFEKSSYPEIIRALETSRPPKPSEAKSFDPKPPNGVDEFADTKSRSQKFEMRRQRLEGLKGDLDTIVLKTLRREPEERYQSVEALAEDVERHLNNLPIRARPATARYRASRFLRRHRAAAAGTGLVLAALIGGAAVSLEQAREAQAARVRAENRFAEVRELSNAMIFEFAPKLERLQGSTELRELIVFRALKYLDRLAEESQADPALQAELAAAYENIGDLQGNPEKPNLSDFYGAAASYRKALEIRRRILEAGSPEANAYLRTGADYNELSKIERWLGNVGAAVENSQAALAVYEQLLAAVPDSLEAQLADSEALYQIARIYYFDNRLKNSYPYQEKSLALLTRLARQTPEDAQIRRLLAKNLRQQSLIHSWDNRQPEAEAEMTEAIDIMRRLRAANPGDALIRQELSQTYLDAGAIHEEIDNRLALENLENARELAEAAVAADSFDTQGRQNLAKIYSRLGVIYVQLGEYRQSGPPLDKASAMFTELENADPKNLINKFDQARVRTTRGLAKSGLGDQRAAIEEFTRAAEINRFLLDHALGGQSSRRSLAIDYRYLADAYLKLGAAGRAAAQENYRAALEIFEQMDRENALPESDRKYLPEIKKLIEKLTAA